MSDTRPVFHVDDDLCTDILHDFLPRNEVEEILKHVDGCMACETLFQSRVSDFEALRADAVSMKVARPLHAFFGRLMPSRTVAGVAVAAAVVLLVLILPRRAQQPALPTYWLPQGGDILDKRSAVDDVDLAFLDGILAYENRDLGLALERLRKANVQGPYRDLRGVYLASVFTLSDRHSEALDVLGSMVITDLPQPWRDQAQWIRYIALAGAGRTGEADILLGELVRLESEIGTLARRHRQELEGD